MNEAVVIQEANTARTLGLVSAALESELKKKVQESGLVVWLDAKRDYTAFVDKIAEPQAFPYPVRAFRGSFLELLLELETHGNDLYPDKVLVHMPGFNTQTIADTPLYELYKAGTRFERGLDTLITGATTGLVRPDDVKAFLSQGAPSLEQADAWVTRVRSGEQNVFLIALEARSADSLLIELFSADTKLVKDLDDEKDQKQFLEHLHRLVGLPVVDWVAFTLAPPLPGQVRPVADLRFLLASWLMAVEFVRDLREAPTTPILREIQGLTKNLVGTSRALVKCLRSNFVDEYRSLAGQFEDLLGSERTDHQPNVLGNIDTFQFEETAIREGSIAALTKAEWKQALAYASGRAPENCFWVRQDKRLERVWQLIHLAAQVGLALDAHAEGIEGSTSLEEATECYRDKLYKVDRAHRDFEQAFHKLHTTELPDEAKLREVRDRVRREYRAWADKLTDSFAKLCSKLGPLPSPDLRQRAVYEQFVHPVVEQGDRVAYFLVDAMRFEMAAELQTVFESKKFRTSLQARLAELPTVTEVGMNALAPVSDRGRLKPVIKGRSFCGFRSGEKFTVFDPATRVQAMAARSSGGVAVSLELSDVVQLNEAELKKKLMAKGSSALVIVRSLELDGAGEKGFHLGTFEHTLGQIREAVQRLQQAGISRFVLAADHGFLLQDQTAVQHEYKDSPKRRHVFSLQPSGMPNALEIPLKALDYDVEDEGYLVFSRDTGVWKTQEKIAPFVHGGNSLQERVIPVLVLERHDRVGSSSAKYEVVATKVPAEGGRQRLQVKLRLQRQSSGLLSFAGPQKISLALRVPGHDVAPQIIEVTPPGETEAGALLIPPGAEPVTVTFLLDGDVDETVRVEIYHPDGVENVTPKLVDGWFDLQRSRRLGKDGPASSRSAPTAVVRPAVLAANKWAESFEDAEFRLVFERIESQESVNEEELQKILQSARRVRQFARSFDDLKAFVPFEVHISSVNGLKTYQKGSNR